MFERYQQDRGGSRRSTWVRVCVTASAIAHAGVVAVLVISSWWNIDKLSIDERPVSVASLGLATAAPPPLASERRQHEQKKLRRTRDLTQTSEDRSRDRAEDAGSDEGDPAGHADGLAGGTGLDPNAPNLITGCTTGLCAGDLPPAPPIEKPDPEPPVVVPEAMLKGYLIAGETQIQAPDAVRIKIARTPTRRVVGVVKLCIDTAGAVTSSSLLKSTGYPGYDRRLVSGVRRWRYKPYRISGKAVSACTSVRFLYILRDD